MPAPVEYSLNGVVLPGERGGAMFATEVTSWRPEELPIVRRSMQVPGQHGTLEYGLPVLGEPTLRVVARFAYATMADLEKYTSRWDALLTSPTLTLGRSSGGVQTTAQARLVTISHDSFMRIDGKYTARITAALAIPGAFMRETVTTGTDLAFNANLTLTELTHLSGSTGPIPDALVRVTGPVTSVVVTDPTTGTGISWTGALTAGQYLFLDPVKLRARISATSSDWASGGSDATAGLSYPAAGPLQLWPIVTGNLDDVKVRMTATRAGSTAATKICVRAARSQL